MRLRRSLMLQQAAERADDTSGDEESGSTHGGPTHHDETRGGAAGGSNEDVIDLELSESDDEHPNDEPPLAPPVASPTGHDGHGSRRRAAATAFVPSSSKEQRRPQAHCDWGVVYVEHAEAVAFVEADSTSSGTVGAGTYRSCDGVATAGGKAKAAPEVSDAEARAEALAAELAAMKHRLESAQAEAEAAKMRTAAPPTASSSSADDTNMCVVCLESERTHALIPCGHRCLCSKCAQRYEAHMRLDGSWDDPGGGDHSEEDASFAKHNGSSKGAICAGEGKAASSSTSAHACPLCRKAVSAVLLVWQ